MRPCVWYAALGIFTSSELPANCPESLVISSRTEGLAPEVTEVGSLIAGGWGSSNSLVPEVRLTRRQLLML
eukprot:10095995-Alexandrium_andersonii.AAC.1